MSEEVKPLDFSENEYNIIFDALNEALSYNETMLSHCPDKLAKEKHSEMYALVDSTFDKLNSSDELSDDDVGAIYYSLSIYFDSLNRLLDNGLSESAQNQILDKKKVCNSLRRRIKKLLQDTCGYEISISGS